MRVCFQLHVAVEHLQEYTRRHAEVWPEMRQALTDSGWRNYSLFLAPDGTLTGYFECDDLDAVQAAMVATEVNGRWQAEMQHFFVDLDDRLPDEGI
jgi:L-rhamnose mutarotase